MPDAIIQRQRPSAWSVVGIIAATYLYFLLFAEFAFLALAREPLAATGGLRLFMGALGFGGVVGSAAAAAGARSAAWSVRLSAGLGGCAVAGLASLFVREPAGFLVDGAAVGGALGWTTVTLASGLKGALGRTSLGTGIGIGTGLAYGACNVPTIFQARPETQTLIAVLAVVMAALAALRPGFPPPETDQPSLESQYAPLGRVRWTAILLALVWLDSAAFYIIQNTATLKSHTWEGDGALATNAAVHVAAALVSGLLLDRAYRGSVALAAWALLGAACLALRADSTAGSARLCYTAGVSLYSVLLVYYPAAGGSAWLAALVYGVAGWLGSALGIGMAQQLHQVPLWFLGLAGAMIGLALVTRLRPKARRVLLAVALAGGAALGARAAPTADRTIALGRTVYIQEGCIHCHSQYIRPGTTDVEWWGPAQSVSAVQAAIPPLLGNRRQGPDLTNVGNRRSAEWERLHLVDPAAVSPGSRMPSYAHLFRNGSPAGPALVDYLLSLGAPTAGDRFLAVRAWLPAAPPDARDNPAAGRQLYLRACAQCHGLNGAGNGPLAPRLQARPANLVQGNWRYVAAYGADESLALARIVKFGVAGTSMPGHEWLSDAQVVALVRQVRKLRAESRQP